MIEVIVWVAMIVGVQVLMYWQAAAQIEELEHKTKQQETEIKELRVLIESMMLHQQQMLSATTLQGLRGKQLLTETPWTDKPKFNVSMDDSHSAAMRSVLKKDIE
jgi:hypothetical protein